MNKNTDKNEESSENEDYGYVPTWTEKDWDDNIDYLSNHPLFCQDSENLEKNEELQALQTLLYDEDPEVLGQNLYEDGNKVIKNKYMKNPQKYFLRQAMGKYDECLKMNIKNKEILKKVYCNKAFLNTKLRNYKKVIDDCEKCLAIDPKFLKAYYRKANALYFVEKYEECIKICDEGLKLDKTNSDIKKLKYDSNRLFQEILKKQKEEEELRIFKNSELYKNCVKKGIKYNRKPGLNIPEIYERKFIFGENNEVSCSVIFIYVEFQQFDFIKIMKENEKLIDILQ